MRSTKRYIVMFLVVALGLLLRFGNPGERGQQVDTFRGAYLQPEIWNPLIAESVNEKEISMLIDNKTISSKDTGIYMNQNLSLMLPVSLLGDSFGCSAHIYNANELLIERKNDEISFVLDEPEVTVNMEKNSIASSMICRDGEYYVPADTVSELLDFSYTWDVEENQAIARSNGAGESILPGKYDLRGKQRAPRIKDQGGFGTCWAFAALSAMESSLLPEETMEFSPDHMSLNNSFYLNQADGGNYTIGMAYLTAWQGPVYEADDPYGDNVSTEVLRPVKHVQEIQIIEHKNYEEIKEAVFKYGGVQTSMYSGIRNGSMAPEYYNSSTSGYCYIGTERANHDVLIIGWDDSYPKENFKMEVEGDGAFICQNSWGDEFGQDGVFYISYYDVNVGSHNLVYTGIEECSNYDGIYQSDLCGWVGSLGYGGESIYGANIYQAEGEEKLMAAGFYALGKDTEYQLYVVTEYENVDSLADRTLVAEGKLGNAGYYTIAFNNPVPVAAGERFAVVLYVSTPGLERPLAIEYAADEFTSIADISDGESYISLFGNQWEHLEESQNSNLCLKVYSANQQ